MDQEWSTFELGIIHEARSYLRNRPKSTYLQRGVRRWSERAAACECLSTPPYRREMAEYILALYVEALLRAEE